MSKFGGLFARKAGLYEDKPAANGVLGGERSA